MFDVYLLVGSVLSLRLLVDPRATVGDTRKVRNISGLKKSEIVSLFEHLQPMGRKGAKFPKSLSINTFKVPFIVLEPTIIARQSTKSQSSLSR